VSRSFKGPIRKSPSRTAFQIPKRRQTATASSTARWYLEISHRPCACKRSERRCSGKTSQCGQHAHIDRVGVSAPQHTHCRDKAMIVPDEIVTKTAPNRLTTCDSAVPVGPSVIPLFHRESPSTAALGARPKNNIENRMTAG
jgi:hypothetical protein